MDPITTISASSLFSQVPGIEPTRHVSPQEEQRFLQALESTGKIGGQVDGSPLGVDQVGVTSDVAFSTHEPVRTTTQSLGGALLDGIQEMKSSFDTRAQRIQEQLTELAGKPMNLQDALRMQFELMQMNVQQELTSKMADKTSQGVQMLFRNQG